MPHANYQSQLNQLNHVKLYRPQVSPNLIGRPHLLSHLDEGLNHRLILVSAPPGFGKTTLVSQWLSSHDWPIAWLSLDEGDNQLHQFLCYLCAAVRHCVPEACANLQNILTAVQPLDVEVVANLLVAELSALPVNLILVLDDYHRIHSRDVHYIMRHLLQFSPSQLHLVILTRTDPPLLLQRLRLGQRLTEIRDAHLRFTLDETQRFLHAQTDLPLDDTVMQALQVRTEGWVIGLQLACISLQSQSPDQFLARFSGSHRLLVGYLAEEVMDDLPEVVAEFLYRTALLERFCAPLCDALWAGSPQPASSPDIIAQLESKNLFIMPLDDEDNWYRYHDLFRDFLLNRLEHQQGREGLSRLHQRAGEWLAKAGLIDDALRHLLAAGDECRAAELVETHLQSLLNQKAPAPVLNRWLDLFPASAIQACPGLCIAQLYLLTQRWELASIPKMLHHTAALVQADYSVDAERRRLRLAVLDQLHGYVLYRKGDSQGAIPLLQRSLVHLDDPVAYSFSLAQLVLFLARALANCGQRQIALTLLHQKLAEATAHHRPVQMIFLGGLVTIHLATGELDEAAATAAHMLATAELWHVHPTWESVELVQVWSGWAHYYLGLVRYEQNDLDVAERHWQQVEAMRYQVNPGTFQNSLTGLAFVAQARGERVQALAHAQAVREFAIELRSPSLLVLSEVLEIRLALLGSNVSYAFHRSQAIDTATNHSTSLWLESPLMTVLHALLIEATPTSLSTAEQLAATGLYHAEQAHNTRQIIQYTARQALIWHALRQPAQAFKALDRALTLGEPSGFIRAFVDLGAPIAQLLPQFAEQRDSSPYLERLLTDCSSELSRFNRSDKKIDDVLLSGITPLTHRELELLVLIHQRLTTEEMAEQLGISPNTVKTHVRNVYTKLGVKNRRQAIARAKDVGLLPSA